MGLAMGAALFFAGAAEVSAQSWRTVTMSRQVSAERAVDVRVSYGAGRLELVPGPASTLYRMELRYDEETFEPVADYRNGRLHVGVDGIGKSIHVGKRESGSMSLQLARDLPMDLELECGAVRADLDLGGLALSGLAYKTGASESRLDVSEPNPIRMERASFEVGAASFTARHLGNLNADRIDIDAGVGDLTLEFTGEWQGDAVVSVDMGLGSLKLRFPRGLGVRVTRDTFLTGFDSEGLIKRGEAYYSPDWDDAESRLSVNVDAAFGNIEVDWLR